MKKVHQRLHHLAQVGVLALHYLRRQVVKLVFAQEYFRLRLIQLPKAQAELAVLLQWRLRRVVSGKKVLCQLLDNAAMQLKDQLLAILKVEVEGAGGDPRLLRHLPNREAMKALVSQQIAGGSEQRLAFVG